MNESPVVLSVSGAVATVAINRPEARNSLFRGLGGMICGILREVAADKSIRVVVFRGVGNDFCPGADLKYRTSDGQAKPGPDFDAYDVTVLLHEMPQVTIAAIRGACAGAGLGWACACDLRVSDETAKFNTAFLDVGVAGDMGVPWTLPRLIGAGRARDLMYFPRKLGSAEAQGIGLIERVWPNDLFETELLALADRLAAAPPIALAGMKGNFIAAERTDLRSFMALEAERHVRVLQTADHAEALKAWSEKRPGQFTGR